MKKKAKTVATGPSPTSSEWKDLSWWVCPLHGRRGAACHEAHGHSLAPQTERSEEMNGMEAKRLPCLPGGLAPKRQAEEEMLTNVPRTLTLGRASCC